MDVVKKGYNDERVERTNFHYSTNYNKMEEV